MKFKYVRGVPSLAGTVTLPRTGQAKRYALGDDGDIEAGAPRPSPRFKDNGNGTVTDNLTGLMWLKDENCFKSQRWRNALYTVAHFNANPGNYKCQGYKASYTDWRLPNRKELYSLIDFSQYDPALPSVHPFTNVEYWYWSSSTYPYWSSLTDPHYMFPEWLVDMRDGCVSLYTHGHYGR